MNEDTPGFEAIENPMALVHEPAAEIAPDLEIRVAGRAVGSSFAAFGDAGVNLFGGSVRAEARGRVVYRSLVRARWDYAVERGTPALTVQAGRMSLPILERLGFELITQVRVFVDNL